jgi:hypothetical protein
VLPPTIGHALRGFLSADIIDAMPQISVPIDTVEGQIQMRIKNPHLYPFLRGPFQQDVNLCSMIVLE